MKTQKKTFSSDSPINLEENICMLRITKLEAYNSFFNNSRKNINFKKDEKNETEEKLKVYKIYFCRSSTRNVKKREIHITQKK